MLAVTACLTAKDECPITTGNCHKKAWLACACRDLLILFLITEQHRELSVTSPWTLASEDVASHILEQPTMVSPMARLFVWPPMRMLVQITQTAYLECVPGLRPGPCEPYFIL